MAASEKKKHLNKPVLILIIFLVIIGLGYGGWSLYKYQIIKGKVKNAVFEKTNGMYTIRYDNMTLDEVGGYLSVTNLRIIPDTAKFRAMTEQGTNPPLMVSISVPELKVAGVKTPEALINKNITGRKLQVSNATVVVYYATRHKDSSASNEAEPLYRQLLGNMNSIQADSVEVNNVDLSFIDIRTGRKSIGASNISVQLRDVVIDSLHANDSSRFYFSRAVHISGKEGLLKSPDGVYFYRFKNFDFDKEGGIFSVEHLSVDPQLSEEKFAAYAKVQKDRFNVQVKGITVKNINLQRLMLTDIVADSIDIQDFEMRVYHDRSYPGSNKIKVGTYPQQLLMKMPVLLNLRKLVVKNAFIEYKEKNPKSDFSGKVQFAHSSAVISNITNDFTAIAKDNRVQLDFHSRFLDMASIYAHISLMLHDTSGKFYFNGNMDAFDAEKLNVLIEPMGLAKIERGKIQKVKFDFKGQNYGSTGKLTLLYDGLKISLLKKDEEDNTLKKKGLASFIANFVVKNSNPGKKGSPRVADVHFSRDVHKSFFNLMWKSIFAGVKETVGM